MLMVVAAALIDADGLILVQQRPDGTAMAGLWEFPGGKIETGESPEKALVRELEEELGIAVEEATLLPFTFASEPLGERYLLLLLYLCRQWSGAVIARHAAALQWSTPENLRNLSMPPADEPLVEALIGYLGEGEADAHPVK